MKRVKLYYLIMAILMVVSLLLVALRVPFSLDIVVFVMGAVFILAIVLGIYTLRRKLFILCIRRENGKISSRDAPNP